MKTLKTIAHYVTVFLTILIGFITIMAKLAQIFTVSASLTSVLFTYFFIFFVVAVIIVVIKFSSKYLVNQ